MNRKINVKETEVAIVTVNDSDYISLTDIAKYKTDDPSAVIGNWMRNRNTIEFLGIWETLYNQYFKPLEFEGFRKEAGLNAFTMSPQKWINATNAIKKNLIPKELTSAQIRIFSPNWVSTYSSGAQYFNPVWNGCSFSQLQSYCTYLVYPFNYEKRCCPVLWLDSAFFVGGIFDILFVLHNFSDRCLFLQLS